MKKVIFYIDPSIKRMYVERVNEAGEKKTVLSSYTNFVYTAEIVAKIIDVETEDEVASFVDKGYPYHQVTDYITLKADFGLYYDEAIRGYKSQEYGFVILDGNKLRLHSPLSVSKDKMRAYYTLCQTKTGKLPKYSDIEEAMHNNNLLARVEQKKVEEQMAGVPTDDRKIARLLVAQGREPINGNEEYFLPLIDIKKKAGDVLADGRIDFKETGSIIEVVKGQELLRRYPAKKPSDGYNVYGDVTPAIMEDHKGYSRGENIVQSGKDDSIYVSGIDGCLEHGRRTISVLPIAYINSDINYDTGNIDFNGSVHIRGSVLSGFSVKATGDINIEKSVEDSVIQADGDITVKMGVLGKDMVRVIAGGNVTAKYLLNARVEAAGEIIIEDSIINSEVFSNKRISVVAKHGKIIGGKTTALYEIIVNVAGAVGETETSLNVGRNLFIERELADVNAQINKWRESVQDVMRQLKANFGEAVFENPKEYISHLPSIKQKKCLLLLKELSNSNKELKGYLELSRQVQEKLKLEREPYIIIKDKAYPGTVINVKKSVKKVDKIIDNVKYYEDSEEKVIRFTPAV